MLEKLAPAVSVTIVLRGYGATRPSINEISTGQHSRQLPFVNETVQSCSVHEDINKRIEFSIKADISVWHKSRDKNQSREGR